MMKELRNNWKINRKRLSRKTLLVFLTLLSLSASACGKQTTFTVSGTVEATESSIVSEVTGRILELRFEEGEPVKAGDVVAILDNAMQTLTLEQAEAAVTIRRAQLQQLEKGARTEQIAQAEAAVRAAEANLEAAKAGRPELLKQAQAAVRAAEALVESATVALDYASDNLQKAETLAATGSISSQTRLDALYARDAAQSALESARQQLNSAKAQQTLVAGGSGTDGVNAAQAAVDQANAQLLQLRNGAVEEEHLAAEATLRQAEATRDQAALMLGKYELKAPLDGILETDVVAHGELLFAGATAATIIDPEDLSVRMYIPQKYLSLIAIGMTLDMHTSALPGQAIRGTVTYLASEAEFTPSNTETTESRENTVFQFKVKLLDSDLNVRPGMTVETVMSLPLELQ